MRPRVARGQQESGREAPAKLGLRIQVDVARARGGGKGEIRGESFADGALVPEKDRACGRLRAQLEGGARTAQRRDTVRGSARLDPGTRGRSRSPGAALD